MSKTDDKLYETDPLVGATYRELARETVPPDVDAAVLTQARRAVASRSGIARLTGWLRPLAFVATAGLSLALILQLSNTPDWQLPDNPDPAVAPVPADIFQDAADRTAEEIRRLGQYPAMLAPPDSTAATAPASESAPEASLLPAREGCDDQARNSSGTWWQCIRELEERGLPEVAEQELQALLRAFPQFSAPQE
ncbi:MAG: hypothetical protein OEM63_02885 [Gammaproteobacteria bacterium]|nr:hypothetical protein [Gammaproteobacteria bacterium]